MSQSELNFSIVIPSRNRPVLLRKAIQSVLDQNHPSYEIIVVNDGSNGDHADAYAQLAEELKDRVTMFNLESTEKGHGQSYAINRGVEQARGTFVCFLDDDDYWLDKDHLKRAAQVLFTGSNQADLYYSNQVAYLGEKQVPGPLWLQSLEPIIAKHSHPDEHGVYCPNLQDLMACEGFQHLNTSIVRTSLYLQIGGMDENIRYECDWDFYLRTIDVAQGIKYYPGITSYHNAPDPSKTLNMSTVVNSLQKLLFRSYVMDKALLFSKSVEIRKKAAINKSYTLKRMAEALKDQGNYKLAFFYAISSLAGGFNFKWLMYCFYLGVRAMIR
jgi:glycosyltransferase involved in cell wall biosynthesis